MSDVSDLFDSDSPMVCFWARAKAAAALYSRARAAKAKQVVRATSCRCTVLLIAAFRLRLTSECGLCYTNKTR